MNPVQFKSPAIPGVGNLYWTIHMYGGPRRVNHAAVAINTSIFTFGGYCSGVDYNSFRPIDIHVLDTDKLKWWRLVCDNNASVPFQRYGHTAVAHGKKIYLWGGRNDREVCNTLYCFDTETLKWSSPLVHGDKPIPRDGHSACIVDNCMYIFGGFQEFPSQFSQDLYMLNLLTMNWSVVQTRGTPPSHRDFHTATTIDKKMYIFGGRGDRNAPRQTDKEIYCPKIHYLDTTTNTWVQPMVYGDKPPGRRSHSAFVHNGFLYIFGGFNRNLDLHFQDVNQYNLENSTWKTLLPKGTPPCARRRHICLVVKDKVFISGGTSPTSRLPIASLRLEEYDIDRQAYSQLKDHDDLHILDLNPSLKNMCLVTALKFIEDNNLSVDELCLPLSLKNDLFAVNPLEVTDIDATLSYEEEFPLLPPFNNLNDV